MPENLSFQSRQEDFRSQFPTLLVFEKQRRDKNGMMLRYKQGGLWKFAEKLEVYLTKTKDVEDRIRILENIDGPGGFSLPGTTKKRRSILMPELLYAQTAAGAAPDPEALWDFCRGCSPSC
jgi:hypothetical protein